MSRYVANISQENRDKLIFCGFRSQEEIDGIVNDLLERLDPEDYLSSETEEIYVDREYDDDYLTADSEEIYVDGEYDDYLNSESEEIYEDTFDEVDDLPFEGSSDNDLDYEIRKAIEEICAMENIDSEIEDELEKILVMLEKAGESRKANRRERQIL